VQATASGSIWPIEAEHIEEHRHEEQDDRKMRAAAMETQPEFFAHCFKREA
jgi:hypothetical protein